MKKKFLSFVIALSFILPSLFLFVGCGEDPIYKINFYSDGAIYQTVEISKDKTFEMPEDPTKDDYTFAGWYFDNAVWTSPLTAQSVASMKLTDHLNVYAKWQYNICTVDFYADNEIITTKNVDIFTELTDIPSVPEKIGYTGVWNVTNFTNVSSDMRVDAVYTANTYTIIFDYNGAESGNDTESKTVSYNSPIGSLPTPTKDGYIFSGWYLSNVQYTASTDYQIANNITLKAMWTMEDNGHCIVATSSFDLEGNTYEFVVDQENLTIELSSSIRYSNSTTSVDFKNTFTVSPSATWNLYADSTCSNAIATREVSMNPGTGVYYILVENTSTYERTIYTVTLKKNRMFDVYFYNLGELVSDYQTTVEEGFLLPSPINPESGVEGYAFKCWSTKQLDYEEFDFSAPITGTKFLYACYENPDYIISEGLKFTLASGKAKLSEVTDLTIQNLVIPQICYTNLYYGATEGVLSACANLNTITIPFIGISATPADVKESLFGIMFGTNNTEGSVQLSQYYGSAYYNSYVPGGIAEVTLLDDAYLADYTFVGCFMLSSINLANNTTRLGKYSLNGSGITELVLPQSVNTLDSYVYETTDKLIKIPAHVTTYARDSIIAPFVFYYTADGKISVPYEFSSQAQNEVNRIFVVAGKELIYYGGLYYIIDENNEAHLCYGDTNAQTIPIHNSVNGYPVTSIYSAVRLLELGAQDFYIPDSVKIISSYSFANYAYYTSSIKQTITLHFNETSQLDSILGYSFYGVSIGEIEWPSSLENLGGYAFKNTSGKHLIFKEGLNRLGYRAFEECDVEVIYLPSSITIGDMYLFDGATSKIFMSGYGSRWNVSYWKKYSTDLCTFSIYEGVSEFKLLNGGVYIRYADLYYLYGVLGVGNSNNFVLEKEIDGYAVKEVKWSSFANLSIQFDSFSLGENENVTSIHTKYMTLMKKFVASAAFKSFITKESGGEYIATANNFTETIDLTNATGVTLEKWAFKTAKKLKTIINAAAISYVGYESFMTCTSLTTIDFTGATFTEVYSNTFSGCNKLTSIILPETLTKIWSGAFTNCTRLTSIKLPAALTALGTKVFSGCSALTSVEFVDTDNWYVIQGSKEVKKTVTSASSNASYLKDATTGAYEWTKKVV